MKKLLMTVIIAALLLSFGVCMAESAAPEEEIVTAAIGDVTFSLTNEQEYYDVFYLYPDEFELEIKEDTDRVRHVHNYHVEGFEPNAVRLVISRSSSYATPEERLADVIFIDQVVTEEINGASWAIGTKTDNSSNSIIVYACATGKYVYTFSFSSDYPEAFDYAEFANVFARHVTIAEPSAQ